MEPTFPVFAAKLRNPDPAAYLKRERLFRRLDSAATPLVVVHGDAGYGKTTLIASYLRERGRRAIWYHLGTTDRVWTTMVAHIRHAVLQAAPTTLEPGQDPLQSSDPELAGAELAALLGRAAVPLTLVLEEYHRAGEDSEIHRLLLAFVEHLPSGVQVYLLSRSRPTLPLSRLAIDGRVELLTKADLAFTLEETAALFARTYNRYLTAEELALVERRLEGWAAGLRLTDEALKLTADQDRGRFWACFAESPALFDYLAEEVLAALPPPIISFLQQTSIFSVLQSEVIEEFLPGCRAAVTLEKLARDNLFTTALDGAGATYRYHNLLRRYLLRRLSESAGEDGVRQLHARAAEIYVRREEIDFAIGHSLAAREYQQVTTLLERLAHRHRADVLLRVMEGWLERVFPDLEGVCGVALRRLLPLSVCELALPGLHRVAEAPLNDVDQLSQAHAQQRLGAYYYYRGRLSECAIWLARSRDAFRAASHLVPASVSSILLGLTRLYQGLFEQAEAVVGDALAWAGTENDFPLVNALWAAGEVALAQGRFQEAEDAARAYLERDVPVAVGSGFAYSLLALALLHQGRLAEAERASAEAVSRAGHLGVPTDLGFARTRRAVVLRASGDLPAARAMAAEAIAVLNGFDLLLARAQLVRAEMATVGGDPDADQLWAQTRDFWESRDYPMLPTYDGLAAPTLLGRIQPPSSPVPDAATLFRNQNLSPASLAAPPDTVRAVASLAPDAPLVILTLGTFYLRVLGRDSTPSRWGRAPSRRLFFYLLLHRDRALHRDQILEALWPGDDPTASSNRLWVAVHVLRKELAPFANAIQRQGQTYSLRLPPGAEVDLARYLSLARDGLARSDELLLRQAASLYRGDFLVEYPYDDFLEDERTRLRELHRRVVTALADGARHRGELDTALTWLGEAQRLDPLLEEPVRRTMEVMLARAEPAAAIEVYRRLRDKLREELGLDPSEELADLYHRAKAHSRLVRR